MRVSRSFRFFLLGILMVVSLAALIQSRMPAATADVPESIETSDLDMALRGGNPPFLLDVREPSEFEQVRIDGAVLIPLGELPSRLSELPKDRTIVVYCRSGRRSQMAADYLRQNGFSRIENLTGGMNAWVASHACEIGKGVC